MEAKYKYEYYVTFRYAGGEGYIRILRDKKIETFNDIKETTASIEEEHNIKNVFLLDWKLLKSEEPSE